MNLFIDDERFPFSDDFNIVRSSKEAINFVKTNGIPKLISFDHDLGGNDTSILFINWLIDYMLDNNIKLPNNFTYKIHSQNPVGAKNIKSKMDNIIKHFDKELIR